jgi:hypothetical protein
LEFLRPAFRDVIRRRNFARLIGQNDGGLLQEWWLRRVCSDRNANSHGAGVTARGRIYGLFAEFVIAVIQPFHLEVSRKVAEVTKTNLVKTLPTQVQVKEFDENYGDNRQRGRLLAVTLA